eukprot:gb/GEZJ01000912.1/.p3 GENE.gb/GEZJ01000912.1/~~gb/GEZJ01000912.1/.p3  ORF type:complete len:139 (+),score=13.15 gb/GEZJ01000912.1/:75-491(+)
MTTKRKQPRLSESSAAVKRLRPMFENGEITGDEAPADVYRIYSLFRPFKLSTFRIRYGKIRDERRKNRKVFPSLSQEIQQKMTTKIVLKPAIMISIWRTRNLEIMKTNTKAVLHKKCFDLLFYTQFGKMRSPPCRFSA